MVEQKVELRKTRDLSENLNDTFSFIRQNFKPLVTSFIGIAGIIMLANAIVSGIYQSRAGNVFSDMISGRKADGFSFRFIGPTYYAVTILGWLNYVAMNVVIACYVKLYDSLQGQYPTMQQVWEEFKKYFLKVLLYRIPIFLFIILGLACFLIPGIYLAVVFMPFTIVLITEDQTFGGAWNRCFNLIKDNFWSSLGIYIVVYLLYSISAGIISSIIGLFTGLISYFTTKDISATIGVVTSVLSIFSFVFYIIFYVSVCLHYFNLAERHDGTGMMRRLDNLGGGGNDFNSIEEHY
jgi:hypothetical protein